jgi:hypothetical protein
VIIKASLASAEVSAGAVAKADKHCSVLYMAGQQPFICSSIS